MTACDWYDKPWRTEDGAAISDKPGLQVQNHVLTCFCQLASSFFAEPAAIVAESACSVALFLLTIPLSLELSTAEIFLFPVVGEYAHTILGMVICPMLSEMKCYTRTLQLVTTDAISCDKSALCISRTIVSTGLVFLFDHQFVDDRIIH